MIEYLLLLWAVSLRNAFEQPKPKEDHSDSPYAALWLDDSELPAQPPERSRPELRIVK